MKANKTKKKALFVLPESDIYLPGWDDQQRVDFLEGIEILGLKKLKKLTRHIGTKTQEDVRIATELYKKEVRKRKLIMDMERQIDEVSVSTEGYNTWLYSYMASQTYQGDQRLPLAVLRSFLEQTLPRPNSSQKLNFPGWRRAEIKDLLAAIELSNVITNIPQHIPTKTKLEIVAATQTYAILCDARKHAVEMGKRVPTFEDLKAGYIYLQCIVAAVNKEDKMKKFKVPFNADPDMAKAQFVLKEWLMPNVGPLQNGWTKDEKYSLMVAIEMYGPHDLLRIQSHFFWKTSCDLQGAICAIKQEIEAKENCYDKPMCKRYLSMACWGLCLPACPGAKQKLIAAKRLRFALLELPDPDPSFCILDLFSAGMTEDELMMAVLKMYIHQTHIEATGLIPLVEIYIASKQADVEREIAAKQKPNTHGN